MDKLIELKRQHTKRVEQVNAVKKCATFTGENVAALGQYIQDLQGVREVSRPVLAQLATLFNKCRISFMISNNYGIRLQASASGAACSDDNEYELPTGVDPVRRQETESFCADGETIPIEMKILRSPPRLGEAVPILHEQPENVHDKSALPGDNDPPSDSREVQSCVGTPNIVVTPAPEGEKAKESGVEKEMGENHTKTAQEQTTATAVEGETRATAKLKSRTGLGDKREKSMCMCGCM